MSKRERQLKQVIEDIGIVDEVTLIDAFINTEDQDAHKEILGTILRVVASNNFDRYQSDGRMMISAIPKEQIH